MSKSNVIRLAHLHRDRGYRFADRDPDMEFICNAISRSGRSVYEICGEVSSLSKNTAHISGTTVSNWLNGKTRRPQNFTLTWVAYAIGYERDWKRIR